MSIIIIRNSATSGSIPSSLIQGELAINVTNNRLFYGSGSGNVVREFTGSSGGGGGTVDTGSFVTTSSFNAYTGSNTSQFAGTASFALAVAGGGGASIYRLTSQTLPSASWVATGSYYTSSFANANITTTTRVDFIPNNDSYTEVTTAGILPQVTVATGTASFYSLFPPQTNIIGEITIFPTV